MSKNIKECPSCGKMIYSHATLCPYCKKRTGFQPASAHPGKKGHLHDTVTRSKEYVTSGISTVKGQLGKIVPQSARSKYSRGTIVKGIIIALLAILVIVLFIAVQVQHRGSMRLDGSIDHNAREVIDSMANEVSQTGYVVAKFPDRRRHNMIYLQEGRLFKFDARTRDIDTIYLDKMNPSAYVDYEGSGILQANITPNDEYVIIVASLNAGNTECALYKMNAETQMVALIDRGKVNFENNEYVVRSGYREVHYDVSGDIIPTSVKQLEPETPKVEEKPKEKTTKQEEEKPREEVRHTPSATEQVKAESQEIKVVEKPKVEIPTKIEIKKPVVSAPSTEKKKKD